MTRFTPASLILATLLAAADLVRSEAPPSSRPATMPTSMPVARDFMFEIDRAQSTGRDYLLKQWRQGNWELTPAPVPSDNRWISADWGGRSALAASALLAGRVARDRLGELDSVIKDMPLESPVAAALSMQYWRSQSRTNAKPGVFDRRREQIARLQPQAPGFSLRGMAHAVVAMQIEREELNDPTDYWTKAAADVMRLQAADGAWSAAPDLAAHDIRSTVHGLLILLTARSELSYRDHLPPAFDRAKADASIVRGLAWVDAHPAAIFENASLEDLWFLQRLTEIAGRTRVGGIAIAPALAAAILKAQHADGSWGGVGADPVAETSFAMLVLTRVDSPTAGGKLVYRSVNDRAGIPAGLRRPADVEHMSRYLGPFLCRYAVWRQIDLAIDADADVQDCPYLWMSGTESIAMTQAEKERLKRYLLAGGLLVGNAETGSVAFSNSFRSLGAELFPARTFKPLPKADPIFTLFVKPRDDTRFPAADGMSNGVRDMLVLITGKDLGKGWQANRGYGAGQNPDVRLAPNFWVYGGGLRTADPLSDKAPAEPVQPARRIEIAQLLAGPNPDPEPNLWVRMRAVMSERGIDLVATPIARFSDLDPAKFRLAHLGGTGELQLSDAERGTLRRFVQAGGTLLVDAAGGDPVYAESAEKMLAQTIDGAEASLKTALPNNHPFFEMPFARIGRIRSRYAKRAGASPSAEAGEMSAIEVNGRLAVLFSRGDLTGGAAGIYAGGIVGCDVPTATQIVRNVILYAAGAEASK